MVAPHETGSRQLQCSLAHLALDLFASSVKSSTAFDSTAPIRKRNTDVVMSDYLHYIFVKNATRLNLRGQQLLFAVQPELLTRPDQAE